MRVGSSPSRLNANTPPVYGNEPGMPSFIRKRRVSPSSSKRGNETLGMREPDRDRLASWVWISLSRTFTTNSSLA